MWRELLQILGEDNIKSREPLKNHCTFRIGGEAKYFVTPANFTDMFEVLALAEKSGLKYKIIGNASNILFSDEGFEGIIICTKNINSFCKIDNQRIIASAGMMLSDLVSLSVSENLTGIEFAAGIPGTLGGAIYMNAGAMGSQISDVINSVTFWERGRVVTLTKNELSWGYRQSLFSGTSKIVLFAELQFSCGQRVDIEQKVKDNLQKRNSTQPKGFSAGSVFKKNDGIPAGKLIDMASLKGVKENDAIVSPLHANFILNEGNATAKDVKTLINKIQDEVFLKFGVTLETEIEIV